MCGAGTLIQSEVTTTLTRGKLVVVIRDAPALVCDNCGEEYFEADVTEQLLEMVNEAAKTGIEIIVRSYNAIKVA